MFGGMLAGQLQTAMAPRGMFGSIGQRARGQMPQQQMPQHMATPTQQPQGLGSRLLGQGWEGKAAALGGLLMGNGSAVSDYHAGQQAQQAAAQQRAMELADAQRERSLDRQDWQWQQDYQRNNPVPTALERNVAAWQNMDPAQRQAYNEYAQAGRPDDWVSVPIPGGRGTYFGPQSGLAQIYGQQGGAPETLPPDFNFEGGSVGNGAGGF